MTTPQSRADITHTEQDDTRGLAGTAPSNRANYTSPSNDSVHDSFSPLVNPRPAPTAYLLSV